MDVLTDISARLHIAPDALVRVLTDMQQDPRPYYSLLAGNFSELQVGSTNVGVSRKRSVSSDGGESGVRKDLESSSMCTEAAVELCEVNGKRVKFVKWDEQPTPITSTIPMSQRELQCIKIAGHSNTSTIPFTLTQRLLSLCDASGVDITFDLYIFSVSGVGKVGTNHEIFRQVSISVDCGFRVDNTETALHVRTSDGGLRSVTKLALNLVGVDYTNGNSIVPVFQEHQTRSPGKRQKVVRAETPTGTAGTAARHKFERVKFAQATKKSRNNVEERFAIQLELVAYTDLPGDGVHIVAYTRSCGFVVYASNRGRLKGRAAPLIDCNGKTLYGPLI